MSVHNVDTRQFTPTFRAVVELMGRHELVGSVADCMAAYDAEYNAVESLRLKEIGMETPEYEMVRKHQKVIRLRMNPEPKKDGRLKTRV